MKTSSRSGTIFSVSLVSGMILFLGAQGMVRAVLSSPTFLVQELEVDWPANLHVPPLRYRLIPFRSLFRVDLEQVADALEKRHPMAQVETVRRVLPNRLVAVLYPARVLAQLKADRYYLVSEEGRILSPPRAAPWPNLPVFFLEEISGPFPVGRTLAHPAFERTSELLAEVHRRGGLRHHAVSSLRARGGTILLFLDSGLEIRLKTDRLGQGLEQLMELAAAKPGILEKARYIDLRFEYPAIG